VTTFEKLWLAEMTWPEVEAVVERTTTVLMPMGSTEQHGPHLAEGTDTYVPAYLAEGVARQTGVPIAPPLWFTTCEQHMSFSGTISLRPTTLIAVLRDVWGSLARHGFRDFVLLNGHLGGAHPALLAAADEFLLERDDVSVWDIDLNAIAADELRAICDSDFFPHAEELEVSQMLAIRPELVDLEKAVDVEPQRRPYERQGPIGVGVLHRATASEWRTTTPTGILGLASHGTAAKGEAILAAQIKHISAFVESVPARRNERAAVPA